MEKPKKAEQATTVVYCGPSIPGVAKQYTDVYKRQACDRSGVR